MLLRRQRACAPALGLSLHPSLMLFVMQTAGMMLARAVLVTLAVLLAAAHPGAAQTLDDCSSLGPGCLQVSFR